MSVEIQMIIYLCFLLEKNNNGFRKKKWLEKNTTNSSENITKFEEMVYTISEVSTLLKVNRNFVYKLISDGYLRSMKLGCRKVTKKVLLEFLNQYDGNEDLNEKIPANAIDNCV